MSSIAFNIAKVRQRIREAEQKFQRNPGSVQLMAVSKTKPAADIRLAHAEGIEHVGENYLQEALEKIDQLQDLPLTWHFIGPIQSNKTRDIAEHFDWVHSVDRLKVAKRLNEQRPINKKPLNLCLQVNISDEASKSGISPEEIIDLAREIGELPQLQLRGLMAIPQATDDTAQQRLAFQQLQQALANLRQTVPGADTLSMGMSSDLESAIAEGATMVRIGTDIFGRRD